VVLSAFALSPARGSEPGIGWNIAFRLAAHHDVTVLCNPGLGSEAHRHEVEEFFQRNGPVPGLEIRFVPSPLLTRWFQRPLISFATPFYFVGYAAWQRAALAEARRLHDQRPFEIAHHLTITGFREAGYLWKLPIPFIWGPVAGAANIPWPYFKLFSWRDRIFYGLKNIVNTLHKRLKFRSKRAARTARQILASTYDDQAMLRQWGCESRLMLDMGAENLRGTERSYDGDRPLRLAWSGLHAGRKALPLLLLALATLKEKDSRVAVSLVILGDGPQNAAWKELARNLGIDSLLQWRGRLDRAAALEEMRQADVFVSTSVQESTSAVVMEALALGLPVICHDACGMGIAVTDACGLKMPLKSPAQSRQTLADAIARLMSTPALVRELSAGALARAAELSWDNKAADIAAIYESAVKAPSPL
jgi:glycosyltransferase involved in cell wall biosynthesis